MTPDAPKTSAKLLRAAAAEYTHLRRHRSRLSEAKNELEDQIARLQEALHDIDGRLQLLGDLIVDDDVLDNDSGDGQAAEREASTQVDDGRTVLTGPAIRETAVAVALERELDAAVHYRDWFDLLEAAGYRVVGKDPLAVFLTQLSRSPLVQRAEGPGCYQLDREAPDRLAQRLHNLQQQLRNTTAEPADGTTFTELRARRESLLTEISQVERALEEAYRVFQAADPNTRPDDRLAVNAG